MFMGIRPKTSVLFLVLLICVFSVMVFGETIVSYHADHECTKKDANCSVCIKINVLKNFLIAVCVGFCIVVLSSCRKKLWFLTFNKYQLSPVALKVRFNS